MKYALLLTAWGYLLTAPAVVLAAPPTAPTNWKSLEVKIIARGPTAASSTGNMDAYLAIISRKGDRNQSIAAWCITIRASNLDSETTGSHQGGYSIYD